MKFRSLDPGASPPGRTPQGVRGLKLHRPYGGDALRRRTPQGVRGLKSFQVVNPVVCHRRTPQGVRGLKLLFCIAYVVG